MFSFLLFIFWISLLFCENFEENTIKRNGQIVILFLDFLVLRHRNSWSDLPANWRFSPTRTVTLPSWGHKSQRMCLFGCICCRCQLLLWARSSLPTETSRSLGCQLCLQPPAFCIQNQPRGLSLVAAISKPDLFGFRFSSDWQAPPTNPRCLSPIFRGYHLSLVSSPPLLIDVLLFPAPAT